MDFLNQLNQGLTDMWFNTNRPRHLTLKYYHLNSENIQIFHTYKLFNFKYMSILDIIYTKNACRGKRYWKKHWQVKTLHILWEQTSQKAKFKPGKSCWKESSIKVIWAFWLKTFAQSFNKHLEKISLSEKTEIKRITY